MLSGMPIVEAVLALIAACVGFALLARRWNLPYAVILVLGGMALAFIPGLPTVVLDPQLALAFFLPPLLQASAWRTDWRAFRANLRPILLLAVGCVLFTTLAIAFVAKLLVPGMPWAAAIALGAIVAPPDAVAASAVLKRLPIPRRVVIILEGESLVNDATALVCYRFALAALLSGEFHLTASVGHFLLLALGGVVVGLTIAHVALRLLVLIQDASAEALLTLITSFACYFAAESLHVSGVIATVAGGLYAGRTLPRWATPETRVEARALWNVTLLAVNALVFTMIGLQLPVILHGLGDLRLAELCRWAVILTCALVAIRFVWVFPATWLPRVLVPGLAKRDPMPSVGVIVVMGWTGMRGVVSLAAALTLPVTLADGSAFAERPLIIFLAYAVILLTLVIPTLTLPVLLRFLNLKDPQERHDEEARARVAMAQAAADRVAQLRESKPHCETWLSELDSGYKRQLKRLAPNLESNAHSLLDPEDQKRRHLQLELFESERGILHDLRSRGDLYDDVYHRLGDELDLEALRVRRNMRPM
jgi:Na+/H+ antiporter